MDTTSLTLGIFLIGLGLFLLVADLIVASGILLVLSLGSIAVGVAFIFRYDTATGVYTLLGTFGAIPVLAWLIFKLLPFTPLGKIITQPPSEESSETSASHELQLLKGRFGKTLTELKPAGIVDFEGRRVDSISEGMMIDVGQWVRCVEVRGNTIVVRPADRPGSMDLETATLT